MLLNASETGVSVQALIEQGEFEIHQGNIAKAIPLLDQAFQIQPSAKLLQYLAFCYQSQKEFHIAFLLYFESLKRNPDILEAWIGFLLLGTSIEIQHPIPDLDALLLFAAEQKALNQSQVAELMRKHLLAKIKNLDASQRYEHCLSDPTFPYLLRANINFSLEIEKIIRLARNELLKTFREHRKLTRLKRLWRSRSPFNPRKRISVPFRGILAAKKRQRRPRKLLLNASDVYASRTTNPRTF